MKTETIEFHAFMSGEFKTKEAERKIVKVIDHFEENKYAYVTAGMAVAFFVTGFGGENVVSAAADLTIDEKAKELYFGKFLTLAKWIIIGKGGWETINKTVKEDFDGAKRSFLQYTLVYILLLGFPWALDQVDAIFAT